MSHVALSDPTFPRGREERGRTEENRQPETHTKRLENGGKREKIEGGGVEREGK